MPWTDRHIPWLLYLLNGTGMKIDHRNFMRCRSILVIIQAVANLLFALLGRIESGTHLTRDSPPPTVPRH